MEKTTEADPHSSFSRRVWMAARGAAAVVLAFSLWLVWHRSVRAPSTDPAEIEQQARERPDDLRAQLQWGEALVQANRMEEAAPILAHAQQLAPNDARPYAWLGIIAISQRRTADARELLHEALLRDPSNTTAIRALANLDARMRRLRPAIQGFERLTQLRPNDADAWQRLGLLLIGAGENYRSLDALTRSAALDPTDLMTQRALGNIALQAGRLDQANHAFRIVLARDPSDPQALTGLAKVIMRMDSSPAGLAAAEQQADLALRAAPSAEAYNARGQIHMAQRRLKEAIRDFNACIEREPRSREPYVLLSQCYASSGQPELARKASAEFERLRAEQLARDRASAEPPERMK